MESPITNPNANRPILQLSEFMYRYLTGAAEDKRLTMCMLEPNSEDVAPARECLLDHLQQMALLALLGLVKDITSRYETLILESVEHSNRRFRVFTLTPDGVRLFRGTEARTIH